MCCISSLGQPKGLWQDHRVEGAGAGHVCNLGDTFWAGTPSKVFVGVHKRPLTFRDGSLGKWTGALVGEGFLLPPLP